MPKSSKRYRRRLPKYPRKGKGRKTVVVNRALQPIPQRYICKMKYSQTFTLNNTTATGYRFNLNSIYDPDRSGVGHQPYGHDTLQTLYNRYRVVSCSYVITAYSSVAVRVAAHPANEEVTYSNVSEAVEQPRTKFILQFPGSQVAKLKGKIYLPSLVGRTKSQYMADDRFQAQFGSSPSENAILNILHGTMTDGFPATTECTIEMMFHVECFDAKTLSQS